MVRWEGFEPPTLWFVARYSIQLSYQRIEAANYGETPYSRQQFDGKFSRFFSFFGRITHFLPDKKKPGNARLEFYGGEGGIRTPEELLTPTPLAGEHLRPLGHLSAEGA